MSPMCSRLVVNARISAAWRLSGRTSVPADIGDEQLDRLVQLVDRRPWPRPRAAFPVAAPQHLERRAASSRSVAHAQGLARGMRERQARGVEGGAVEMARPAGVQLDRPVRQHAREQARHRPGQQDEGGGERQVEPGVEVDHRAAGSGQLREPRHGQFDRGRRRRQPISLNRKLPTATRRAAGASASVAVTAGVAPPRLAPSTRVQAPAA